MPLPDADSTPREVATFVLPGAVGLGLGAFVGLVAGHTVTATAALAAVGLVAGHAVGYLLSGR